MRKLQDSGVFCHFYPAGCTDLLQLVDAGIGSATTTYMKEFLDIWLEEATDGLSNNDRLTRKRAEGNHVSARERRVLYTNLLAKAWTKLCDKVDFYEIGNKVGNNLAADGSRDNLIKIEGLDTYSFEDDDAAWGATAEHPNPTPEEARKAKAHAARNAWVFVDKILEPGDDSDSDSEVDFIQRSELSDSDSESDKSGAEGE